MTIEQLIEKAVSQTPYGLHEVLYRIATMVREERLLPGITAQMAMIIAETIEDAADLIEEDEE